MQSKYKIVDNIIRRHFSRQWQQHIACKPCIWPNRHALSVRVVVQSRRFDVSFGAKTHQIVANKFIHCRQFSGPV